MALLVDSTVFIGLERATDQQRMPADDLFASLPRERLTISTVTAGELLAGIDRAATPAQRQRREAFVERAIARFRVLSFDLRAARAYGLAQAQLARTGQLIGDRDLMIASIALSRGLGVLTGNVRHFDRITGLRVERWSPSV